MTEAKIGSGLSPGPQGQISVVKENGSVAVFPNLGAYVDRMKALNIISIPLELDVNNVVYHSTADQV